MGRSPAHRAPRPRRLAPTAAGGAAAAAVAVVVLAQTLLLPSTDTAEASPAVGTASSVSADAPTVPAAPTASAAPTPPGATGPATGDGRPAGDVDAGPQVLTVIGDSYMNGKGAADGEGMGRELARRLGMDLVLLAEGGTGWADDGPDVGTVSFDEHAAAAIASDPDLVVVSGGFNDHAAIEKDLETYDDVRDSARDLLTRLAEAPAVQTVVVGPTWVSGNPPASLLLLRDVLRAESERAGVDFVDPLAEGWITGDSSDGTGNAATMMRPDRIHPTPRGHRFLGRKMASSISALR